nr:rep protein [Cressdnaviricota sp.]UOF80217.1 rep protein [Cressdnaviricota sp.]
MFCVRFHTSNEQKVVEWISSNAHKWFAVKETDASREHIQGILESTKTIRALRESIRREFEELAGNKGYSLKTCNSDFLVYLCKGPSKDTPEEPCIVMNNWLSDEDVQEKHEKYWDRNEKLKKPILQELKEWHKANPFASFDDLKDAAACMVVDRNQAVRMNNINSWAQTCWVLKYRVLPRF